MANHLARSKQVAVLSALVEGCSIRSTERMTGVARMTISRLLRRVGAGCAAFLDRVMVDLDCRLLEVDEVWSFIGKKQRHTTDTDPSTYGDCWVYVALDAETKLVPCYQIGKRTLEATETFIENLAGRLRNRVQLSSDGLRLYIDAVERSFGADIDYGQIVKSFEVDAPRVTKHSPPKTATIIKTVIQGRPDPRHISTSFVERQNLTLRMRQRRFTRLTNAFSKTFENHCAAVALHYMHYNFVALHRTLRCTPALAAGITKSLWSVADLLEHALEHRGV